MTIIIQKQVLIAGVVILVGIGAFLVLKKSPFNPPLSPYGGSPEVGQKGEQGGLASKAPTNEKTDAGEGNVTFGASFIITQGATIFTVSLNTHTVNLDSFNPAQQITLKRANGKAMVPVSVTPQGEGHHRSYTVSFPRTEPPFSLIVTNLAGIPARTLLWQ